MSTIFLVLVSKFKWHSCVGGVLRGKGGRGGVKGGGGRGEKALNIWGRRGGGWRLNWLLKMNKTFVVVYEEGAKDLAICDFICVK